MSICTPCKTGADAANLGMIAYAYQCHFQCEGKQACLCQHRVDDGWKEHIERGQYIGDE